MEQSTTNHVRFDRHEIFDATDRSMVMNAINEAGDAAFDMSNDKEIRKELRQLENSLYGLFDGYLYDNLYFDVKRLLSSRAERDIKLLVNRIALHTKN